MPTRIPYHDAMASQPEQLVHVLTSITASLDAADLPAWTAGSTLGVVAMGASRNSGHALVAALAERGVRAVNTPASELLLGGDGFQPADYYLVVSESGRSPEPLEVAARLGGPNRVGITNFPHAQIAGCVDAVVGLGEVPDSGVYTVGYTGTLLAYALLLGRLGLLPAPDLDHVPALVGDTLTRHADAAERAASVLAAADSIDVVGQGTSYAAAAELALMLREGVRKPAAAFETFEYLHGPMECLTSSSAVVLFGDGRRRPSPTASSPPACRSCWSPAPTTCRRRGPQGSRSSGSLRSPTRWCARSSRSSSPSCSWPRRRVSAGSRSTSSSSRTSAPSWRRNPLRRDAGALSGVDLVVFDCDGVLVDSERVAVRVDQRVLAHLGWTLGTDEIVERFLGGTTAAFREAVEQHLGRALPESWESPYAAWYEQAFTDELVAVDGIEEALDGLDVPACVASNGPHSKLHHTLGLDRPARPLRRPRVQRRRRRARQAGP